LNHFFHLTLAENILLTATNLIPGFQPVCFFIFIFIKDNFTRYKKSLEVPFSIPYVVSSGRAGGIGEEIRIIYPACPVRLSKNIIAVPFDKNSISI
jgi:hypothetical protein